jgi:hypothetical protein
VSMGESDPLLQSLRSTSLIDTPVNAGAVDAALIGTWEGAAVALGLLVACSVYGGGGDNLPAAGDGSGTAALGLALPLPLPFALVEDIIRTPEAEQPT